MNFILKLLEIVGIQILGLFGIFFVFGFILFKLQEKIQKKYRTTIGWKGILLTAWVGTPIHELGHVFFAKIFRHKIHKISLFEPNKQTGGLGHVEHSYNKLSLYQRIGNFFVGAAPMIFGSVILIIFLYFFVPNAKEIFIPLTNGGGSILVILNSIKDTLIHLFTWENISAWNFWIFLYISFCISAHIAPSKQDRRGMWQGFFWIILILILINAIALGLGTDISKYIISLSQFLGILIAVFTYAVIISIVHLLLISIIFFPLKK